MAGTVQTPGLNYMADGLGQTATLDLVAAASTGGVALGNGATQTVTFTEAAFGVIDITSDVTLTIDAGETVGSVDLRDVGGNNLAYQTLASNNAFPSGGDLIVTSFQITVSGA